MPNPIRRLASRQAYTGRLVTVRVDDVLLPADTRTTFEYVEVKPGACVLPIDSQGNVFLIREWKYAVDRPSIEVVSGGVEPGEEPLQAATRELREEAGLEASCYEPLGVVDPFTSMLVSPQSLFIASDLTSIPREPEEAEVIEPLHVSLTQAVEWVLKGTITHAASCTLILKAAFLQK